MTNYKLLVLDLDGTLLEPSGTISAENKRWIANARKAGMNVTFASGRHRKYMRDYAEELGITAPIVSNNGCDIWLPDGTTLRRSIMPVEHIRFLYGLAQQYGLRFRAYAVEGDFEEGVFRPESMDRYQWLMWMYRIAENGSSIKDVLWATLTAFGKFELSMAGPFKLDVNSLGISKELGVQYICAELGVHSSEVVAIGDGLNDVKLLRWAGLGIAMDNASCEVKAAADRVTADFRQDGVALAIRQILEQQSPT